MLLTGAAGGGKSKIAAEKIIGLHKRYPNSTGIVLRKAREFCMKSVVPFIEHSVLGADQSVAINKSGYYFDFANGSQLFWGGMKDQSQRESIRSIGKDGSLDWVWIEEGTAFSRDDFEEILARMRGKAAPYTQVIITTNPDSASHWINTDLIRGSLASVHFSNWRQNPHNPAEYADRLDMLRGARRARLRDGLWVAAEGRVYYAESENIIDPITLPSTWKRFIAIDFGVRNPTAVLWFAVSPNKKIYCYRELYANNTSYKRIANEILRLSANEVIIDTFCDHDAGARLTFLEQGLDTTAAVKDVNAGIDLVNDYLSGRDYSLKIFNNIGSDFGGGVNDELSDGPKVPNGLLDELPGYVWDVRARDGLALDKPVKANDHACDALRYFCLTFSRRYAESSYQGVIRYKSDDPYRPKSFDQTGQW